MSVLPQQLPICALRAEAHAKWASMNGITVRVTEAWAEAYSMVCRAM